MMQKCVALLGRRDEPTDAIEEYCRYLGGALREHDLQMEIVRTAWKEKGWGVALSELRQLSQHWRGAWVFAQFTALAWSERGFPGRFLRVLRILREAQARVAVVYHDVEPYSGSRLVDRLRRGAQIRTLRSIARYSDLRVFTVDPDLLSWRPSRKSPLACIPVGANFPDQSLHAELSGTPHPPLTVAVYGITGGAAGTSEMTCIAAAMHEVAQSIGPVRLRIFGRNAQSVEARLRHALRDTAVDCEVLGVLSPGDVASALCRSDVQLDVRGAISTRRGSAIAGVACGLPVVAHAGAETGGAILQAGLALYEPGKPGDLVRTLTRVLSDPAYRASLAARSRAAHQRYFSWSAIAARYAEELRRIL
jgi:hypothetical protein